jgi:YD repeat-containing protein
MMWGMAGLRRPVWGTGNHGGAESAEGEVAVAGGVHPPAPSPDRAGEGEEVVTDWNLDVTAYAYDDAGRMTTVTLPSGTDIVSTYTYDDADRLLGIEHVKGGTTTLAFVEYTLDDVGNRVERVDDQGTAVPPPSRSTAVRCGRLSGSGV